MRLLRRADDRLQFASIGRTTLAKVFPDHWSFMLGEIALYSFIILVITGIYLTIFFEPSSSLRIYHGSYLPDRGKPVSSAFASTVALSWDVRGGLLIRQAHHWAAHIFIAAIILHLCRIYFTGMFRKPRELNWTIGLTLLVLAIFNAFAGYSLPDDLLSGIGLHIFYSIALSIPVVGGWLAMFAFGGDFPGHEIIQRLYALHILVVPAIIAILIAAHLGILIRQKHSHFGGPGRSDANVVGSRMWPSYAVRSLALFAAVAAATFLAGGFAQINPIWVWGDFDSSTVTSPSVADWYIAWIEGALRLFPPVQVWIFGYLIPDQFWAGVALPALTFAVLYAWPFIDRRITGDRGTHHVTGRPRESPIRVAIGVAALCFFAVLLVAAAEELIVEWTGAPIGTVRAILRVFALALPPVAAAVAYWLASVLRASAKQDLLSLERPDLVRRRRAPSAADARPEAAVPTDGARARSGLVDGEPAAGEPESSTALPVHPTRSLSEDPTWLHHRVREEKREPSE
jgi:ubiquinol-cytochrome c reductase cytochrome b subunit